MSNKIPPHLPIGWGLPELHGRSLIAPQERDAINAVIPPESRYLEIGICSAVTLVWLARWRAGVRFLGVDIYADPIRSGDHASEAVRNRCLSMHNVQIFVGSLEQFCQWAPEARFETIVVDGNHSQKSVAADLEQATKILTPGGWLLVHDYDNPNFPGVRLALDAFAAARAWTIAHVVGMLAMVRNDAPA